jgi:hypothetical protein
VHESTAFQMEYIGSIVGQLGWLIVLCETATTNNLWLSASSLAL